MFKVFGDRNVVIARELTKKFEEYIRGKLSDVLEDIDSLKGEIVVIVEGNTKEKEEISDNDLLQEIAELKKNGKKNKEIVSFLCDKYNLKKNNVYDLVVKKED
jgi:16S rRNA (cytidine1402-2'-O)-methyltransferase